jgi:hypothetical protein
MKQLIISEYFALSLSMILFINGCASGFIETFPTSISPQPINTLEADVPMPTESPQSIAEVEELAGFDVKEPTYLPTGVSFDRATFQELPFPKVILHFKLIHETYGDMGAFFQILQTPQAEALPNPTACGASGNDCERIQIGDLDVNYRLTTPTEFLMWEADGFSFHLLRTAGEPNKIYKDELLKVVGSMT